MKKTLTLLIVLIAVGLFASQAFAANVENEGTNAGKSLVVGASDDLTLNFSPKVAGQYITEGTTGNEQWFAIGTYHGGGQSFYATSAQQTAIWKKSRETTQEFSDAAIPTTEANSNSETQWTSGSWSK